MYKQSLLSVSILAAISPALYANEALANEAMADDAMVFDEVVVSATRSNTQIVDTAASVAVISEADIEDNMIESLEDLFKYTPGVSVQTNPRQGVQSINIRGVEGNRVKVLVDGVSQGNQFTPGGPNSNFINSARVDIDTDLVKAVEIVKGAASSLHGSDAIGGIVAFETKDPADFLKDGDFGGHAKINYSSKDSSFRESVALANRFGDVETLLAYTRTDGKEVDNFGDKLPQDASSNDVLAKLHYQVNDSNRIELNGMYIRNDGDIVQEYSGYSNGIGTDVKDQYQIGIKHIWDINANIVDTLSWQFDWIAKKENGVTKRLKDSNNNYQRKDYIYDEKGYQVEIQLDKYFTLGNTEHFVVYGASYVDKDIKNTNMEYNSVGGNKEIFYIPGATEHRYGLFAQDEISLGDFIFTPGIRYDAFKTKPGDTSKNPSQNPDSDYKTFSDSAVTARLGTVYKLNEQNRVFAQVSQGFRAPDFQELYYSYGNPNHGYINRPNPDLKAEESLSYELGLRNNTAFSNSEVAVFYSDYDNFIDTDTVSGSWSPMDPAIIQYVNINKAIIKGVEFSNSVNWDAFLPVSGVSTRVAATYTDGEDGNNDPLNSVNPWNLVAGISYDSVNNWGTTFTVNYMAKKDSSDINGDDVLEKPSATILDLTAYYRPMKDLTLRAGVFNLTNEEYYYWSDVRDLTLENKDLTQAKRNWAVTAKYEF
ncbi:TonB-dependent hemoglobin/transferrin/lactoferrin family receptor [Vibrio sp. SM6]|uniref:TonB-dependent hemoglobin/transferrin/lactoferrin family receptor n=1 Tax=Vibrio agarilyticus TaxID=2726741 RepID=A0A7X8TQS8_9VIBR|nr:TonB-dependent hemoglobin/transferrin/lactoferrin family receptor [Vibrio agarilyticus]NLS12902.1 TonB-dependent hemoglobin/transferrin/lactoferrin family receptor [Vibrio agarilyticus]